MSKKTQQALIPKLRFPEFRGKGEWVSQKLSNVLKKISIPVQIDQDEVYQEIGIRSHVKGIFHKEPVQIEEKKWIKKNLVY